VITYSKETLYYFTCQVCGSDWVISNYMQPPILMTCPRCGHKDEPNLKDAKPVTDTINYEYLV